MEAVDISPHNCEQKHHIIEFIHNAKKDWEAITDNWARLSFPKVCPTFVATENIKVMCTTEQKFECNNLLHPQNNNDMFNPINY